MPAGHTTVGGREGQRTSLKGGKKERPFLQVRRKEETSTTNLPEGGIRCLILSVKKVNKEKITPPFLGISENFTPEREKRDQLKEEPPLPFAEKKENPFMIVDSGSARRRKGRGRDHFSNLRRAVEDGNQERGEEKKPFTAGKRSLGVLGENAARKEGRRPFLLSKRGGERQPL